MLQRRYDQISIKLIRFLRALHQGTKGAVRAYINTGVRQGEILAPVLFNLFLDAITAATLSQHAGSGVKLLFNCGKQEENEGGSKYSEYGVC